MKTIKFILILLIFISCKNQNSPIDVFYTELKKKVDDKELSELRKIPRDSLFKDLSFLSENFVDAFENHSKDSIGINTFLEVNDSFPRKKTRLLLLALHSKLNNQKVELQELESTLKEHYIRLENELEAKNRKIYEREIEVVKENNDRFGIGDTIVFLIPIEEKHGKKHTFFNGFPTTLDYSHIDDTLVIKGILEEKFYENQTNPYPERPIPDPVDLTFKIKIMEMSDKEVNFEWTHGKESFKVGEYFPMNLGYYGRPIE